MFARRERSCCIRQPMADLLKEYATAFVLVLFASLAFVRVASRRHLVPAVISGGIVAAAVELVWQFDRDTPVDILARIAVGTVVVVLLLPRLISIGASGQPSAAAGDPRPRVDTSWRWGKRIAWGLVVLGPLAFLTIRVRDRVVAAEDLACFERERLIARPDPGEVERLRKEIDACRK